MSEALGRATNSVRNEPFLECHYYDDGLRYRAFHQEGDRPTWAPPADWVGLRDEFALSKSDSVIELAKFRFDNRIVTWIGVFTSAKDFEFGDRQNYSGIGVWCTDCIITSPAPLISTLAIFPPDIMKRNFKDLERNAQGLLSSRRLLDYLDHAEYLPDSLSGLYPSPTPDVTSEIKEISDSDPSVELLMTDVIYLAQFIPKDHVSRILLRISGTNTDKYVGRSNIERVSSPLFPRAIARRIPSGFADIQKRLAEEQRVSRDRHLTVQQLESRIRSLESQLAEAISSAAAATDRAASFERALNEDDDQVRFKQLYDAIADAKRALEANQRVHAASLGEVHDWLHSHHTILTSIEKQVIQPSVKFANSGNPDVMPPAVGQRVQRHGIRRSFKALKWWQIAVIIAVICTSIFLIIWYFILSRPSLEKPDAEAAPLAITYENEVRKPPTVLTGRSFKCTPVQVWDGDGPIWCAEGPRVRLAGVAAREMNGSCMNGHPCPTAPAEGARDALVDLLGDRGQVTSDGHVKVSGPTLECQSEGAARGDRTAAWCVSPTRGDLSCAMVATGTAIRWAEYWGEHECAN